MEGPLRLLTHFVLESGFQIGLHHAEPRIKQREAPMVHHERRNRDEDRSSRANESDNYRVVHIQLGYEVSLPESMRNTGRDS